MSYVDRFDIDPATQAVTGSVKGYCRGRRAVPQKKHRVRPRVRAVIALVRGRIDALDLLQKLTAADPGAVLGAASTAADFASVLDNVAGFLREQQRGLLRLIASVQGRSP